MGDPWFRKALLPTIVGGIIATVVGGIILQHYTKWVSPPAASVIAAPTQISEPVAKSTDVSGCAFDKDARIKNIEKLSYASDKDDRYMSLVRDLVGCGDYSTALDLVPKESYSSQRDILYAEIITGAVKSKEFKAAKWQLIGSAIHPTRISIG
jgi:hypothetical protein